MGLSFRRAGARRVLNPTENGRDFASPGGAGQAADRDLQRALAGGIQGVGGVSSTSGGSEMSRDWKQTFRDWSKPGSETEQERCANAEWIIKVVSSST